MEPSHYSNREIDLMLNTIKAHIDEAVACPLARIEAQTIKTNGRVGKLENWRNYIAGGIAVLTFIGIPLLSYYINSLEDTKNKLAEQVLNH
jgi:hypothetical protein